jgi:DNA polymerase-3 subunit alpha
MTCPATWDTICNGNVKGVFQLEGHLGKIWATQIKPRNIEELSALISLIRPGCIRAVSGDPPKSMTKRYRDRKNGTEPVEYFDVPELEPILEKTYGVLTYQEQCMKISIALAGFNESEADILRKAIGKKRPEIMKQVEGGFLTKCEIAAIVDKEKAAEIFGWIRESQKYSFNKSHGVSYGYDAYWAAYCKTHFPLQFYCASLDMAMKRQGKYDEVAEIVQDMKKNGYNINPPNLCHKRQSCYIIDNGVWFGLSEIKGLGTSNIKKLLAAVQDKDLSEYTWLEYLTLFSDRISKTVNEALISSGALDQLKQPESRMKMLYEYGIWNKLTQKEKEWYVAYHETLLQGDYHIPTLAELLKDGAKPAKEDGACFNKKRVSIVRGLCTLLDTPPHPLFDTAHFVAFHEKEYLGTALTCNVVDDCKDAVYANTTCKQVYDGFQGYTILAVTINTVREHKTKNKQTMAFVTASDKTCAIDNLVCFPDDYSKYKSILTTGNTVLLHCTPSTNREYNSIIIKDVWQI